MRERFVEINIENVDDLIFFNKDAKKTLPEYAYLFSQWSLGKTVPGLSHLSSRSRIEFLNNIRDIHLEKLKNIFKVDIITVKSLNTSTIKTINLKFDKVENFLNENNFDHFNEFTLSRDEKEIKLLFWR